MKDENLEITKYKNLAEKYKKEAEDYKKEVEKR